MKTNFYNSLNWILKHRNSFKRKPLIYYMRKIGLNYLPGGGMNYRIYQDFKQENDQKELFISKEFKNLIKYFLINKENFLLEEITFSNNFNRDEKETLKSLLTILEKSKD
ncbi:hypothetical protein COT60_02880 [Candidatus Pacearchaeota archaeon CG09_land_8_20_14_0_10_30_9]|nr:MAG: hypothetical protein AUJ61_01125 [Candidatus Pacearchaeota archaeon CG1_02_30_18]PIN71667.1 MAG: hypothetical protein COV77_00790 [Candidatus Pacearchaeota archaeon CG11_big_fil_rev_8_21_14_0_20_30_13]PIO00974.1 MAG: hypothetical protein COT60_02880 [Candidatus Pacearchaeota archaeon CG09_land_8_20_14_0_10_30_9]PIZ82192.1 MAG: hypothetical protein COX98_00730 [Candidatus Pacearchaeota archaeon CG_4_10_14_0_2_um_filter_30_11]PJA71685.1 MAG: hypothetical protein CO153_00320 [Candidatus Pa